nr:MAG TPA: hypothetical protein [Caudoviricetes sp.]
MRTWPAPLYPAARYRLPTSSWCSCWVRSWVAAKSSDLMADCSMLLRRRLSLSSFEQTLASWTSSLAISPARRSMSALVAQPASKRLVAQPTMPPPHAVMMLTMMVSHAGELMSLPCVLGGPGRFLFLGAEGCLDVVSDGGRHLVDDAAGTGFAEVEIDLGHPRPPLEQWFEKRVENPQVGTFRRNNADCGFSQGER